MRKLIVCNGMSLDGYYSGLDDNVLALFDYRREAYPADDSFDRYNAERLRAADTLLLGRASYEGFKGYWPPVAHDPTATPINQEISRLNSAIAKVVISDTLTSEQTAPWQNTRIIRRADAYAHIAELKRQTGNDIVIFGSHTLWNDLLAHDLVDELHFLILPVIVGAGTPLFVDKPPASLRLIDTHTWDQAGTVLVRYAVRSPKA